MPTAWWSRKWKRQAVSGTLCPYREIKSLSVSRPATVNLHPTGENRESTSLQQPLPRPNRRVLVTGATGFIGRHLVRSLIQRGDDVRAMGRNPMRLVELRAMGCEVVSCDLRDSKQVAMACRNISTVVHVGALSTPWGSWQEFLGCNVRGTQNVLAGCLSSGVKRCVFISSPSVTSGKGEIVNQNESAEMPRRAISQYSLSKRMAEQLVVGLPPDQLETVVLRPKAVFGPGDEALLPRLTRAARVRRLRQIGSGLNKVDLTYVDNVVQAIELSIDSDDAASQTFLITNDEHPMLWEVIRYVCREMGLDHKLRQIPRSVAYAAATALELRARLFGGEPLLTRYSVTILAKTQTYDISHAKQRLGYRPRVSLEEGIARTLADLKCQANA